MLRRLDSYPLAFGGKGGFPASRGLSLPRRETSPCRELWQGVGMKNFLEINGE